MNVTKKTSLLLVAAVALVLLALSFSMPSLASQQAPGRSPDQIRALYEAGSERHRPSTPEGEPAPPPAVELAGPPPTWSRLAFFSFRNNNWDIYLVDPDGTNEVRLTSRSSVESYPALRAGAESVLFASDREGDTEIYVVNADGFNLLRLTTQAQTDTSPAWSPDGSRISFQSYRTGNSDIFVMNADGSGVTRLTTSAAYDGQPGWSPDGTQIVFSSDRTGGSDLWIMNADGTGQHRVTTQGSALYPAWSPAGDKIAYACDGDGDGWLEIWQMNVDGSDRERLWSAPDVNQDLWGPAWAPDGAWLAMTETTWELHQGYWYWTESYLRIGAVGYPSTYQPVGSDDRAWKSSWAATDASPPTACTLDVQARQTWSSFILRWSAEDEGAAGVGAFEVQVRTSPSSPWQEVWTWTPFTAQVFHTGDAGNPEFRCRARDRAHNAAPWEGAPVSSVSVDAAGPSSRVSPLPEAVRGSRVTVSWAGSDRGRGVAGYDLLVRDGTAGDWQVWQHGLPGTSSEFAGSPGHTYYFRTQARDLAGHLEPWQPSPQAVTTLYTHVLSGTVTDLRGHVGMVPSLDLEPATAHFPPDPLSGVYRVYLGEEPGYTLAVSATGYGALPTTALDMAQDSRLDLVLPPQDEAVANGAFEAGSLDGWAVSGEGAQAAAVSRHTGAFGLHIAHAAAASTVLSQAVSLSEALHRPTISLMVRIPSDLEAGEFSVQVTGPLSATLFQASEATPGWVHVWADLSPAAGQVVTVTLKLSDAVGLAEVDEVSIGSWQTPLIEGISPADWSCGQVPLLSIAGQNLVATPTVYLGGAELADVTWVSSSLLTAGAPPALPPGRYDLVVANPNGSATTMPGAVTVTCHSVFLPLAVRDGPRLSSPPGAAWPTLGHDVKHTGRSDTDPGASRYALTWAATLPFPSLKELRSIAVADGVLVASDDGREGAAVVALDAGTGSELWRLPLWDKYSVNPPSIAHSAVYFQKGHSYNDSYLFCLDLYSGEQYWQAPFMVQWDDHQAPLVVDDAVFIQAGYYGGMYGFDAATGQELWYTGLPQYDNWAPAYADGTLYTWVAGFFRAHSPATGEILWTLDIGGSWHHYAMNTAPVIAGRTAVVVSAVALNAVDLDTRTVRWTVSGDYDSTIPAAADGVVYALRAGTLEARSLANGSLLWSFSGDQALANAPLVAGQYVYAASGAHTYVIDRTTHALMWQADHGGWLAVADGFLYIGQPDMTVYAYRAQEP